MIRSGYAKYNRTVATTVEKKEDILVLLYETLLTEIKKARMGIEEENARQKGESISKVLSIITELDCALDLQAGGDIAENLSMLYQYVMGRLTDANLKSDLVALNDADIVLTQLNDGFKEAMQLHKSLGVTPMAFQQGDNAGRLYIAV